ncbi:MAG: YCF48-related protein, partial [Bacteroidota bacterium]
MKTIPKNSPSFTHFGAKPTLVLFLLLLFFLTGHSLFAQWQSKDLPTGAHSHQRFKKIEIIDNHKWLMSANAVFKTTDNGVTWSKREVNFFENNDIAFVNQDTGFVVGAYNEISKTVDGGETWTSISLTNNGLTNFRAVHFVGRKGWIIGHHGIIFKTEDAGENWAQLDFPYGRLHPFDIHWENIYFINDKVGFIFGGNFRNGFYKTEDGGENWTYFDYQVRYISGDVWQQQIYAEGMHFTDEQNGHLFYSSFRYTTSDGGLTWEPIFPSNQLRGARRMLFLNKRIGWATRDAGDIRSTFDGGKTWQLERAATGYQMNDINIDKQQNVWVVGDNSQFFENSSGGELGVRFGDEFIPNRDSVPSFLDGTDFETATQPTVRQFIIQNTNTDTLLLNAPNPVAISGSAAFQIANQPTTDTLFSGDSTHFELAYTPDGNPAAAQISIGSNAKENNPFDFAVQGNCSTCSIEGERYVCAREQGLTYTAPSGMTAYHWQIKQDWRAKIIGPNNEQTVTVDVDNEYSFELQLIFEETSGCIGSCEQTINVGLPNPSHWNFWGPSKVCAEESLVRFFVPSFYAAKDYHWEVTEGDAVIIGAGSLSEIYVNVGVADFEINLTMGSYVDCEEMFTKKIEVQHSSQYFISGPSEICPEDEFSLFTAPTQLVGYRWKVFNADTIFYVDTTGKDYVRIGRQSKEFTVQLEMTTSAGCTFFDEKEIEVADEEDCTFEGEEIIYVNVNILTGNQDGASWANAFTHLQNALEIAEDGDQIWVAKGIYHPLAGIEAAVEDTATLTFEIDKNIQLYGGFLGTETGISERDWENTETILSGDINGDDVYLEDIHHPNFPALNNGENVHTVVHVSGNGRDIVIDGFTVRGGNAKSNVYLYNAGTTGGGIYIGSEKGGTLLKPLIQNCKIVHNVARLTGGGLMSHTSSNTIADPILRNNSFIYNGNTALTFYNRGPYENKPKVASCLFKNNNGGLYAGGVHILTEFGKFSGEFYDCQLIANRGLLGGGIRMDTKWGGTSQFRFINGVLMNNESDTYGGGIFTESRDQSFSYPRFIRTKFIGNKAKEVGGGGYNRNIKSFDYNYHQDCLFTQNSAGHDGGAFYHQNTNSSYAYHSYIVFERSTIAYNKAGSVGGIRNANNSGNSSNLTVENSILWKNANKNLAATHSFGTVLENSLVEDVTCPENVRCQGNNIFNQNPLFVDSLSNLSLRIGSPAIDQSEGYHHPIDSLDIVLNSRKVPGIINGDSIVDLGAYEFQNAPILTVISDTQLVRTAYENRFYDTLYTDEERIYQFVVENVGSQSVLFEKSPIVELESNLVFSLHQSLSKNKLNTYETDTFRVKFDAVTVGDNTANLGITYNNLSSEPHEMQLSIHVMPRPDTPRLSV